MSLADPVSHDDASGKLAILKVLPADSASDVVVSTLISGVPTYEAVGDAQWQLPVGIYRLRVSIGAATHEQSVVLRQNETIELPSLNVDSPIPMLGISTATSETISAAVEASRRALPESESHSSLLIFAWAPDSTRTVSLDEVRVDGCDWVSPSEGSGLYRSLGDGQPWVALVTRLTPGPHTLSCPRPESDGTLHRHSFFAPAGRLVQMFIRLDRSLDEADFALAIAFTSTGFDPADLDLRMAEIARLRYLFGLPVLAGAAAASVMAGAFGQPIMGILAALELISDKARDQSFALKSIASRLETLLAPDAPDVVCIRGFAGEQGPHRLKSMPLVYRVWAAALESRFAPRFDLASAVESEAMYVAGSPLWLRLLAGEGSSISQLRDIVVRSVSLDRILEAWRNPSDETLLVRQSPDGFGSEEVPRNSAEAAAFHAGHDAEKVRRLASDFALPLSLARKTAHEAIEHVREIEAGSSIGEDANWGRRLVAALRSAADGVNYESSAFLRRSFRGEFGARIAELQVALKDNRTKTLLNAASRDLPIIFAWAARAVVKESSPAEVGPLSGADFDPTFLRWAKVADTTHRVYKQHDVRVPELRNALGSQPTFDSLTIEDGLLRVREILSPPVLGNYLLAQLAVVVAEQSSIPGRDRLMHLRRSARNLRLVIAILEGILIGRFSEGRDMSCMRRSSLLFATVCSAAGPCAQFKIQTESVTQSLRLLQLHGKLLRRLRRHLFRVGVDDSLRCLIMLLRDFSGALTKRCITILGDSKSHNQNSLREAMRIISQAHDCIEKRLDACEGVVGASRVWVRRWIIRAIESNVSAAKTITAGDESPDARLVLQSGAALSRYLKWF